MVNNNIYICPNCKKEFIDKYNNRKFCSLKCSTKSIIPYSNFWKTANYDQMLERIKYMYEKKVIKKDGCWDWKGSKKLKGYGIVFSNKHYFRFEGKTTLNAHRASYLIYIGKIPAGLHVLHKCHNTSCSNPEHLYLGTNQDNVNDMMKSGRNNFNHQHSKTAKLNIEKVQQIRELLNKGISQRDVAKKFDVSHTTIRYLVIGKSWRGI